MRTQALEKYTRVENRLLHARKQKAEAVAKRPAKPARQTYMLASCRMENQPVNPETDEDSENSRGIFGVKASIRQQIHSSLVFIRFIVKKNNTG